MLRSNETAITTYYNVHSFDETSLQYISYNNDLLLIPQILFELEYDEEND